MKVWKVRVGMWMAATLVAVTGFAQTTEDRVNEIVYHTIVRASGDADTAFDVGAFPLATQNLTYLSYFAPSSEKVVSDLIFMLLNIDRWDQLIVVGQRYADNNPNDPDAGLPLAERLFALRTMYPRVVSLLEPRIHLETKPHPNSYRVLAHSYSRMGLHADAVRVWEELLKFKPDDVAALRNLEKEKQRVKGGGID